MSGSFSVYLKKIMPARGPGPRQLLADDFWRLNQPQNCLFHMPTTIYIYIYIYVYYILHMIKMLVGKDTVYQFKKKKWVLTLEISHCFSSHAPRRDLWVVVVTTSTTGMLNLEYAHSISKIEYTI